MAKKRVYGFDEAGFLRVREATRRVLGSPRTGSQRRRQVPIVGGGCKARNEIWLVTILGSPTGGTFDMDLTINGSTETLTFSYNFTAAQVQTEMETHTEIASSPQDVDVGGGPFPDTTINITFLGLLASHSIPAPVFDWSSLTGGTGTGVIVARYQPGYPRDAS